MSREVRVGVVGLGKMGLLHASLLNTFSDVKLVALCEKSSLVLRFGKKIFRDQHLVDNVQELHRYDLDAALVTTPIPSHFAISNEILTRGIAKHLFVEKTLSSSYENSEALCKLAETSKGVNMVGYMKRFNVMFRKAKQMLADGVIGEVTSFDAFAFSSDFASVGKGSNISASRGGVLRDLGGHIIDLALWFFGNMTVKSAKLEPSGLVSEDAVQISVKTTSGLHGSFAISWCEMGYRLPEFGLTINGSNGIMRVTDDKLELKPNDGETQKWYRQNLDDSVAFLLGDPEYFREDKQFIKAILEGGTGEPSFLSASRVDYVLDQVKNGAVNHG